MTGQPVEWALVVYYGRAAHQAVYGRQVREGGYTKDYIQLSRKSEFSEEMINLFPILTTNVNSVPLTFRWPGGTAPGAFVFRSADRPHLKWETNLGAPQVWKMALRLSDATTETIPGDPTHLDFADAEKEFALLANRGAGQPYLVAIKLLGEPRTLHLRVYLENPSDELHWADLGLLPREIRNLTATTSRTSALAWSRFGGDGIFPSEQITKALAQLDNVENRSTVIDGFDLGTGRALIEYLRRPGHGIFFDPTKNHDAWLFAAPLPEDILASFPDLLKILYRRFPAMPNDDSAAETLETDSDEVESFRSQIRQNNYEVIDSFATSRTRGSAQRAFAEAVKSNYGYQCAVAGIVTKDFLVASHIVPWSSDQTIRLDPSNGICLSSLVDRAFENGYLMIGVDLTIRIDWKKVGEDQALRAQLEQYDGQPLRVPSVAHPNPDFLQRRIGLVTQID